ncbi:MAG: metal-dependent hydrolase [Thermoplasmatota archaeon]
MVSWVPQIVVPPLLALAFFPGLPRKWVMALAPTIFLSDLDYAFPGEHRVYTHTLVIPALFVGILLALWRRRGPTVPLAEFAVRPGWPVACLLVAYYLCAHALMDVFTGGVTLFWPLSQANFAYDLNLFLNTKTNQINATVYANVQNAPAPLDPNYPWFTDEHNAILAPVVAVLVAFGALHLWRRRARRLPHPRA